MMDNFEIIAHVCTDFPSKFGLPRQSGLAEGLRGRIVFEKKYRVRDAFRGLEDFGHIWVIWKFSEAVRKEWSPTVRPPRLGGNTRLGVFATRSPFRPNPVGLSCLKLDMVDYDDPEGPVLLVSGIDMMDGTPVYDVKPYLPYADSRPDSKAGFTEEADKRRPMKVDFCEGWDEKLEIKSAGGIKIQDSEELKKELTEILSLDPRPSYHEDAERIYGFNYSGLEIKFKAEKDLIKVISASEV